MLHVTCAGCNATFTVEEQHAGKKGKCRHCGGSVEIPLTQANDSQCTAAPTADPPITPTRDALDIKVGGQGLQLTTTSSLEGWVIKRYVGPVSAHVVAGTGFFSDLAASFTDVFGGRSLAYQQQLASLEQEAIQSLRDSARDKAANWVIGLRLDFDEISGKGMQMFMVSAHGTAVDAVPLPSAVEPIEQDGFLLGGPVRRAIRKASVLHLLPGYESGQQPWTEHFLQAICDVQAEEAIPACVALLADSQAYITSHMKDLAQQLLRSVPRRSVQSYVQNLLLSRPPHASTLKIHKELMLLDPQWVLQQLGSADRTVRLIALQTLCGSVSSVYVQHDIAVFYALRDRLPKAFPETCTYIEEKGMFGRKPTMMWRCEKGHDNELSTERCWCGIDRHGIALEYFGLEQGLRVVNATLETLADHFGITGRSGV